MEKTLAKLIDANRELVRANEIYRSFFEKIPDLMAIAKEGRFIALSKSWEEVTGWTREELMSRPFVYFVVPEDAGVTVAEDNLLRDSGEGTPDFVNHYRTKDGGTITLRWRARTVDDKVYAVARVIS